MKKKIIKIVSLMLTLAMIYQVSAFAENTYEGMSYEVRNGQVAITDFPTWTEIDLVIPDTIEEKPVTILAENCFYYCRGISSIYIPKGITSIERNALKKCYGLRDIKVSEENPNFKSIDGNLYSKDGKKLIQYSIYKNEKSVTIPEGTEVICDSAFDYAYPMENIIMPDSVKTIEYNAFYGCEGLTDLRLGDGVETIGNCAFNECKGLKNVVIPNSVKTIDMNAFRSCGKLQTVTIGSGVTKIGDWAFKICDAITDVYYCGSEAQWKAISIGKDNETLKNANIHFNSTMPQKNAAASTVVPAKTVPQKKADREFGGVYITFLNSLLEN